MWQADELKRDECGEDPCEDGNICHACRDGHADDEAEGRAESRHREDE